MSRWFAKAVLLLALVLPAMLGCGPSSTTSPGPGGSVTSNSGPGSTNKGANTSKETGKGRPPHDPR